MRSPGFRFLIVGILMLLMLIPLKMVSGVVEARSNYSQSTITSVGREWGGPQTLYGPQLVIPVREVVTRTGKREVVDPVTGQIRVHAQSGEPVFESFEVTETLNRAPVILLPGLFDVAITSETEIRHRGIFDVPVYRAKLDFSFDLPTDQAATLLADEEQLIWDEAELQMFLSGNNALRGEAALVLDGNRIALEPMSGQSGIFARSGDLRGASSLSLTLGLNGADQLLVSPVGRQSNVTMTSDWPDPSFTGAFLPDQSEISETGFTANWTIPHLARALPQVSREDYAHWGPNNTGFGVRLFQPNSFYQKAWRASNYGILFVALTFLTVLLVEGQRDRPVHPVQYILIGLAQAIFTLLMLAYAEQIGFGRAYLLAAGATVALLVMFGATGLKLGRRTWVLGIMLSLLYGVLYLILESTDFALIAGATLAFLALAATMIATRNENWYGATGPGQGLFSRRKISPKPPDEKK